MTQSLPGPAAYQIALDRPLEYLLRDGYDRLVRISVSVVQYIQTVWIGVVFLPFGMQPLYLGHRSVGGYIRKYELIRA